MLSRRFWPAAIVALAALSATTIRGADFELVDGDRVVTIGATFVERAPQHGYDETRFSLRWPERNITFRNLGWSGDTVWADARAGFDTPAEGFKRLSEQVKSLRPTVVFVAYGGNEAFAGPEGLDRFRDGLKSMLDMLSATGARLVMVSPTRFESPGGPLPEADAQNQRLEEYVALLADTAHERQTAWVDLFGLTGARGRQLTENGIHLSALGYWEAARATEAGLGLKPLDEWRVTIDTSQSPPAFEATGTQVAIHSEREFSTLDAQLPPPLPPDASIAADAPRQLKIVGLGEGRFVLAIDDQPVHTADSAEWAAGVTLTAGPEFATVERLRETIRVKNQYYFYRWRPENETYLLGFRKYEQGQNAKEIAQFDKLIAEKEAEIARLRKPVKHLYRLTREVAP